MKTVKRKVSEKVIRIGMHTRIDRRTRQVCKFSNDVGIWPEHECSHRDGCRCVKCDPEAAAVWTKRQMSSDVQ
jgi:hypothetical protein